MTHAYRTAPVRVEWHEKPFSRLAGLVGFAVVISALGGWTKRVRAADEVSAPSAALVSKEMGSLQSQVSALNSQVAVMKVQLERHEAIATASQRYGIPADLAAAIHDIALSESVDPALAFRLVKIESNFVRTARSTAGAYGLTQVRLPTARFYYPDITEEQLVDRSTNLRVGFRFLRDLLNRYDGDEELALLAYNRGPQRVNDILAQGGDPDNGYAHSILKGVRRAR